MALRSNAFVKRLFIGAASAAFVSLTVVPSGGADEVPQTADASQGFDIPSQPLSEALAEFARQSKINVVAPSALTRGRTSGAVSGEMPPAEALRRLTNDSAFDIHAQEDGSFILVQAVAGVPKSQPLRLAQSIPPVAPSDPAEGERPQRNGDPDAERDAARSEEERRLGRVTVTGTLIRGLAPESSPLLVFDRDEILQSGAATTDQFIRTLTQNFGGGATEYAPGGGLPGDADSTNNTSFGSGPNLRGLGSSATLTLLNGRRLAPSSAIGHYVDISHIPASAIDRIELLTDGATSAYGSDAVAGVVNIILRDDFEGIDSSVRYGTSTQGGASEQRWTLAAGKRWTNGGMLATFETMDRDRLSLADRPKILPFDTSSPINPSTHNFDLLPSRQQHSAALVADHEVSETITLFGQALYSHRAGANTTFSSSGLITDSDISSEVLSTNLGVDLKLSDTWYASLNLNYGKARELSYTENYTVDNPTISASPQRIIDSEIVGADLKLDGEVLALPAGPVLAAIGGQYREEAFDFRRRGQDPLRKAERSVTAIFAEFQIPVISEKNALPGLRRVDINLSGRWDEYSDFGSTTNPKAGILISPFEGLKLRSSYSTAFAAPALGRAGAIDRGGFVSPFASVLDQFGVEAAAPELRDVNMLQTSGTSAGLRPEESRAYTFGFDYNADWQSRAFRTGLTYYNYKFEGRVGNVPIPGNPPSTGLAANIAYLNPELFPPGVIIFNPTPDELQNALDSFAFPIRFSGGLTEIENIGIINNVLQQRNLAIVETSGIDFNIVHDWVLRAGRLSAGLHANYIFAFDEQAAATTPQVSALNTLYKPVDLKLNANISYANENVSSSLRINYIDSYRSDGTEDAVKIQDWTTVDVALTYSFNGTAWWSDNLSVSLFVQNLFDEAPPKTPTFSSNRIPNFDPTNASALGRYASIELRKRF